MLPIPEKKDFEHSDCNPEYSGRSIKSYVSDFDLAFRDLFYEHRKRIKNKIMVVGFRTFSSSRYRREYLHFEGSTSGRVGRLI